MAKLMIVVCRQYEVDLTIFTWLNTNTIWFFALFKYIEEKCLDLHDPLNFNFKLSASLIRFRLICALSPYHLAGDIHVVTSALITI
jgi:hypothetical protein